MTPRKKLIEVALPLEAINVAAAREKSIRHGHPSTLHLWWARRPLAACRAVLFASLVDDPDSDPGYRLLGEAMVGKKRADLFNLLEELVQWENSNNPDIIRSARAEIARCVASRLIETGKLAREAVIGEKVTAAKLVACCDCRPVAVGFDAKAGRMRYSFDVTNLPAAAVVDRFLAEHAPPVLDPFAGGGSIPLEAQRLGLVAHASDLNPVAVLINKALIEIPPKFANRPPVNPAARNKPLTAWQGAAGLADDVRYYGKWMRDEAEKRIGHLYPKVKVTKAMAKERPDLEQYVGEELTVIAWLWARTIECPNPSCRARTPLVRSFWLSTKKGRETFAQPILNRASKTVRFEIRTKGEPIAHTTDRNGARCLFCDTFIKKAPLRDLAVAHGIAEIPLAVVVEGSNNRLYLPCLSQLLPEVERPKVDFLEQPMTNDRRWFSPPLYGMPNFADLFTSRQLVALTTFSDLVQEARERVRQDGESVAAFARTRGGADPRSCERGYEEDRGLAEGGTRAVAYADAVATYLALATSKASTSINALARWRPGEGKSAPAFGRQAIPMVWDYTEINPFAGAGGDFLGIIQAASKVIGSASSVAPGKCENLDSALALPQLNQPMISTDPPYYDNISYADLSDFFYLWLRKSLRSIFPNLLSTVVTPKSQELIASSYRHRGSKAEAQKFFETSLGRAFVQIHNSQGSDYPTTVYYAFKQAETDEDVDADDSDGEGGGTASTGWETMLEGLIRAKFTISGTWPSHTEGKTRLISMGTNALASSIILVCRPRPPSAALATRKEFITALRADLPEALRNLQRGNIAPVDLAQASIGPGMAVFTRFAKVIEADGSPMRVRSALQLINQALDEVLAEQEGDFDGDTRWALAWFEQFGMDDGPYGTAEVLSKAKDTAVNALVEAGVVKARAGKVRLVKRDELPDDWDPAHAGRLTVWEATQYLIRSLDKQGESGAALLLPRLGGVAETARDLAYRLYIICERKKWAAEALAYNGLVIAWPELSKLALAKRTEFQSVQTEFS